MRRSNDNVDGKQVRVKLGHEAFIYVGAGRMTELQGALHRWKAVARFISGQSLISVVVRLKRRHNMRRADKVSGISYRAPLFMQGDGIRNLRHRSTSKSAYNMFFTQYRVAGSGYSLHITTQLSPCTRFSTLPLTNSQSLLLSANSTTSSTVNTPLYRSPSLMMAAISLMSLSLLPSIK